MAAYTVKGRAGTGKRFQRLKDVLGAKPGVRDPGALAADRGRKKFGKKRFQRMAAKGRGSY